MKIKEITDYLESLAPLNSQESYDNCGLIVGNKNDVINQVLISLDCVEATVEEAIQKGCNLIIAHHPIVFRGIKKFNGKNYVERTIIKAIKNDVAIYAIHTNFDNYRFGVNHEIGQRLKLSNLEILSPKKDVLNKVAFYVPREYSETVRQVMYEAGAGEIGDYAECSFSVEGRGTFKPVSDANPFEGRLNEKSTVDELKVELLTSTHHLSAVIQAMKEAHPYEEVAHEIYSILNPNQYEGAGMIGELEEAKSEIEFLREIKEIFQCGIIRHTGLLNKPIKKVAFCGGAGSFLLPEAKRHNADVFITGDFKYHEFFDADEQILIADIGHFESEQYTSNRIENVLTKKFPKFAVHLTEVNTNPINYF